MPDAVHQQTLLSVYQVARTPYQTLRAEIEHGHWAISFVREGVVETLTRGVRDAAPAGSVMIHPPSLPYAEYAEVPGTHEWVVFECDVRPGLALLRLYPVAAVVPLSEPAAFSARKRGTSTAPSRRPMMGWWSLTRGSSIARAQPARLTEENGGAVRN